MGRARILPGIAAVLMGVVLAWVGWLMVGGWQVRAGLAWAGPRIAAKQYEVARARLAELSTWWPRQAEVEYLLGVCEAGLGRPEAALAAWARVPPGSPSAAAAALARGRTLVQSFGKLTEAEAAYHAAARGNGAAALEARWALAEPLLWEGRLADLRRLLREIERIGARHDRTAALRELWRLDSVIVAAEEVRPILDRAARSAPDDPGVCLARAHLAVQSGRYAEARDWLDTCRSRHPDDARLARARLQWALAAEDLPEARTALDRIPAQDVDAGELASLQAWFAARRNDPEAERIALESLLAVEPGQTPALDRLVTLAIQAGQADRAVALRRRQEQALQDKERYRRLLIADRDPIPQDELHERARLAERLGRGFEARGWLKLILERDAGDRAARAAIDRLAANVEHPATPSPGSAGPSLLDRLGETGDHPETTAGTITAMAADTARSQAAGPLPHPGPAPEPAAIFFRDDSAPAGLDFTYYNGESPQRQIPETIGGGVVVLDYDGDGWLDVYLMQGGPFPSGATVLPTVEDHEQDPRATTGDRLFHNRGDGTFENATVSSGLARIRPGYAFAATAGDYDGDGRPDLFVARWRSYLLLHNRGDGTFEDTTEKAGLGGDRDWPTSAAFADLDGDGDLDLYVCHYLDWDAQHPTLCTDARAPGRHVSCLPLRFPARPDHLFRNDGGRFVDVTATSGILDRDGRGLGVVATDLDGDGRADLFVANDMTANRLYRNRGDLKFEEIGHPAGVACNAEGGYQAGMGVACGDLDGDGRPDLAVTNFFGESTTWYRNLGRGLFADATTAVGLKAPSRFLLGFGITFLDVDNDGGLDLATANGHIHDLRPTVPYAMPAQLLTGDRARAGRLTDVSEHSGAVWTVPRIGRGLAQADLDNDGRVDLLLVAQNSPMAYLHNRTERTGHFLTLRLEGTTSNRDAIGAVVSITCGGRRQTAWRFGGGSYASAGDPRLHFGLGQVRTIDAIEVHWPSGRVDRYGNRPADTGYLIREGEQEPRPLAGLARPRSAS